MTERRRKTSKFVCIPNDDWSTQLRINFFCTGDVEIETAFKLPNGTWFIVRTPIDESQAMRELWNHYDSIAEIKNIR